MKRAEADVWVLFRRILTERKRRELDPTLHLLEASVAVAATPGREVIRARIDALQRFFALIDSLASRLLTLDANDLDELGQLFGTADATMPRV
jgi:hypothetical protein